MNMRKSLVACIAAALTVSTPVVADEWPQRNITMIVPYDSGGSIDRFARGLAQHWERQFEGVSMIVENRPGASGLMGAMTFLNAKPDGHTIFVGIQPTLSMNILVQDAGFTLDDFAFVNFEQNDYGDVVVNAGSRFKSIHDFVDAARTDPGKYSAAMILGGGTSIFGLALLNELNLDVRVVTFDSGGALRTNMLGNHSDITISGAYGDVSLGEKARVLTVASEEPFPGLPDAVPISQAFPNADIPAVGDSRFVAVHRAFAEDHPDEFATLVESYKTTFESEVYQAYLAETNTDVISSFTGAEAAEAKAREMHTLVERFADVLRNQ